jgi:hypothetical protein
MQAPDEGLDVGEAVVRHGWDVGAWPASLVDKLRGKLGEREFAEALAAEARTRQALQRGLAVAPPPGLDARILRHVEDRAAAGFSLRRLLADLSPRAWTGAVAACSIALVAVGVLLGAVGAGNADGEDEDVIVMLSQADLGADDGS